MSDLGWGPTARRPNCTRLYVDCPPSGQRRTNATSRPAQSSNSNWHQHVHTAGARSSLRTRNENASSCMRHCIACPSHLDRRKFIRISWRLGDQSPRDPAGSNDHPSRDPRHLAGFHCYWRWKSLRDGIAGRPTWSGRLRLRCGPSRDRVIRFEGLEITPLP